MYKNTTLSQMELNRINEIRFRTLLAQMLNATNNNFMPVIKHIKHLATFMDFNVDIIIDIIKEIFDTRYAPTTDEIIKINLLLGSTIKRIADILDMKESTVKMHIYRNQNNINTIVIYPRLALEKSQELQKFLQQYYKLYVPANIVQKV